MGPKQTWKFLYNKEIHKKKKKKYEKKIYGLGENICKQCNQQRLNFQSRKTAHKLNTLQKQQQPNQKLARTSN